VSEKELLWVDKELVDSLKNLDTAQMEKEGMSQVLKNFQRELELWDGVFNAATLDLRRKAENIKKSYKQLVDEEIEGLYIFWESQQNRKKDIEDKFRYFKDSVPSLSQLIDSLNTQINNLDVSKLERCMNILERFSKLSQEEKEALKVLFQLGL